MNLRRTNYPAALETRRQAPWLYTIIIASAFGHKRDIGYRKDAKSLRSSFKMELTGGVIVFQHNTHWLGLDLDRGTIRCRPINP